MDVPDQMVPASREPIPRLGAYMLEGHRGKLIKLPRTPNIQDICTKYCKYRSQNSVVRTEPSFLSTWYYTFSDSYFKAIRSSRHKIFESTTEIMKGLCFYFDKALLVMLLYKSERQQYADAIRDNVSPSMVYGAEHLLRLFDSEIHLLSISTYGATILFAAFSVKSPELLAHANNQEETLTGLHRKLVDFLRHSTALIHFLQKNQSAFYLSTNHAPEDSEGSTDKQDH
ncbi:hypothetical protein Peur_010799 [Populus x canadensis]